MRRSKFINLMLCAALTLFSALNAHADDTEVFFGGSSNSATSIKANILLILDTSGSMNRTAQTITGTEVALYTSSTTYSDGGAGCDSNYVYMWPVANGTVPTTCTAPGLIAVYRGGSINNGANLLRCHTAIGALDGAAGYYGGTDYFIRLAVTTTGSGMGATTSYTWSSSLSTTTSYIECKEDSLSSSRWGYAMNSSDGNYPKTGSNSSATNSYTSSSGSNWWTGNTGSQYYFFSPNYIRYQHSPPLATTRLSRLDVVKTAVASLLSSISNVNVGLMRYDSSAHGGMVVEPIAPLTDAYKTTLTDDVNAFVPGGGTPLSETLYEAYQYLHGGSTTAATYGNSSHICTAINNADQNDDGNCTSTSNFLSAASSRVGGDSSSYQYNTPLDDQTVCAANNHIIYLTDGLPTSDDESNGDISTLTGTACSGTGGCLSTLAGYMFNNNMVSGNISKVKSHFIGFGADLVSQSAIDYLTAAATAGGGQFKTATNITTLTSAFNAILAETVADTSATFVSPSVAVNSFNKTQVLEDMYIAMFKPAQTTHWDGNLKKFKLREIDVPDTSSTTPGATKKVLAVVGKNTTTGLADTVSAVDTDTGFFKSAAKDFWQTSSDVNEDITTKGGATNLLPDPNITPTRKVYTYVGSNHPSSAQALSNSPFTTANTDITDTLLGTSSSSCGTTASPCRSTLINWVRGDTDGDGDITEADPRKEMGDPVHSQPAVVIYANDSSATTLTDKVNDAIVYLATNDGYLHAIDVVSGEEKWSYIPQEVIGDMKSLYVNAEISTKHYSLDGDIRVLKYDVNNNGVIDTGGSNNDRVILYFSQGRGGDNYYALDVTDKNDPKFLWGLDGKDSAGDTADDMSGVVHKSWSTPVLGRVNVSGKTQNSQKLVLIFGGGYDDVEDTQSYVDSDTYGRGIFMVDAIRGTVLWRAGSGADSTANLQLADMTHAIPSSVTVLDTDSDSYTDRMYVGDMAGQLWRFDIANGNAANSLVAGGVIASLGGKINSSTANNRNFYNAPDVSKIVVYGGASYYNLAIGSGDRALPKSNVTTEDRFYSIRDYHLGAMTQATYNAYTAIHDADLTTVTGNTAPSSMDSRGWKLILSSTEKALASSITLDGIVLFSTFIPGSNALACEPTTGTARAYTMNISSGLKNFSTLYETFNTTGLPSQVNVVNADKIIRTDGTDDTSDSGGGSGGSTSSSSTTPSGSCLSGVSILGRCVDFGDKVKTIWKEAGAN